MIFAGVLIVHLHLSPGFVVHVDSKRVTTSINQSVRLLSVGIFFQQDGPVVIM